MGLFRKSSAMVCYQNILARYEQNKIYGNEDFCPKLCGCLEDKEYLEIELSEALIELMTNINVIRTSSMFTITDVKGEAIVYIFKHFGTIRVSWAKDIQEDKDTFNKYEKSYAIEHVDNEFYQILITCFFEAVHEYFFVLKYDTEIVSDLFWFTKKKIKFDERKFGRYISLVTSIKAYIDNQIKTYDLLPGLVESYIQDNF